MKRIKLFLATFILLLGIGGMVPALASAATQTPKESVCSTLSGGSNSDCSQTPAGGVDLNNLVRAIINVMSVLIGVVAVIMIMVSGYKYITAGGDSNKVTSAKNTLIYAIIGLLVAALAQVIVVFVLRQVRGCPAGQSLNNTTGKCQAARINSAPLYAIMYRK